jgi:Cys-tRNA(Pro)/Cys-tRNA(Cys) deacylase
MADKLNSLRLLEQRKIPFQIHKFPDTIHSAAGVADYVGKPPSMVYKTLVVLRTSPRAKPMLIMVAGDRELDLKRVAKAIKEKKVRMATHQEAEKRTGLKVGGISALALLNRGFEIYIDEPAQTLDTVLISAGQRGVNVELPLKDLVSLTQARWIQATWP